MKYLPFRPLFDNSFLTPWLEEDDWPMAKITRGLNIFEENSNIFVEAAVPGVQADKIKVTYEDGVLRITAKTEEGDELKKKGRVIHQWSKVANFEYSAVLPRPIDSKKIEAELKEGVLTIKAPLAEEAKAKQITVKTVSR